MFTRRVFSRNERTCVMYTYMLYHSYRITAECVYISYVEIALS